MVPDGEPQVGWIISPAYGIEGGAGIERIVAEEGFEIHVKSVERLTRI
jgi:hypothetical protein